MRTVTVMDYERVVHHQQGRLVASRSPAATGSGFGHRLQPVDLRVRTLTMGRQELLTADWVSVKVGRPRRAASPTRSRFVQTAQSTPDALYLQLQLALREPVASTAAADLLSGRVAAGEQVRLAAQEAVAVFGVALESVAVRDLAFPGVLKALFAEVVRARQEGLAALERSRAEVASVRALASAAGLLRSQPRGCCTCGRAGGRVSRQPGDPLHASQPGPG